MLGSKMSKFLQDFAEFIKENNCKAFSIAEIIGDSSPEKIEITENNASPKIYSFSKMYTVTAVSILYDRCLSITEKQQLKILPINGPKTMRHIGGK